MLTKKQKELFDFLDHYIKSNQISPSFEEMKEAVNLKSKSGIHRLITSLEQRGYIKRLKHKARAMEIAKDLPKNNSRINGSDGNFLNIPLVGSIAAGVAIEAINSFDSMISVPKSLVTKHSTYFGLKVRGLSMIDEGILDGDIVIINKKTNIHNGDIIVALIDKEEATLKKFRKKGDSIALEPANKNYKTQIYGPDRIVIQGKMSGLIRSYSEFLIINL